MYADIATRRRNSAERYRRVTRRPGIVPRKRLRYAYNAFAFLSPAVTFLSPAVPDLQPSPKHNSREGIREQLRIAPRLRCQLHFQPTDEHSHCMPDVPYIFDHNDSEESEFRQLLALRTLR